MKESVALGFIYLALLGIGWLVAIVIAVVVAIRLKTTRSRTAVILVAVLSVPLFLALSIGYDRFSNWLNLVERRAIAKESSALYRKICAQPQQLSVPASVKIASPVDISVKDSQYYPLDVLQPVWPRKTVCWMDPGATDCPKPPIANTGALTAPFVLNIAKLEQMTPLIERFKVVLVDSRTSTQLGETYIIRKSWFGDLGDDASKETEPRHCPDRDIAIGTLLDKAFVLQPQPSTPKPELKQ